MASNQIKYKVAVPGKASTGADGVFDDLATKSQTVGQDNTRTEWVSTKHVKFTDKPTVLFRTARENVSASQVYTGTAYQTVSHGSSGSTEITFTGVVLAEGDVMRFNWSWRTDQQGDVVDDANVRGSDFWWIQLQILEDTGGGAAWRDYGFPMRQSIFAVRDQNFVAPDPVAGFRMYSGTFCEIATGTKTITGVRAQVKAETATGEIVLKEWNLSFKIIGA